MSWLVAALLGLQAAPPPNPDWWYIANAGPVGTRRSYYSDLNSLARRGDLATIWEHSEYEAVNSYGSIAATVQYEYDCRQGTARMVYSIFYSPNGSVNDSGPGAVPTRPVNPGTVAEAQFAFACGDRARGTRVGNSELRAHAVRVFG